MTDHGQTPQAAAAKGRDESKSQSRMRPLQIGLLASALALAALAPASAQLGPMGGRGLWDYTGVLTPFANIPPRVPNTWFVPIQLYQYQVPQAVYVPVPVPV